MNVKELDAILCAAYALHWSVVLACPRISERLRRPVPVEMIRQLVAAFASQGAESLTGEYQGVPIDYDPQGAFRDARPLAASLEDSLRGWDGALPVPSSVMVAAQSLLTAYGHESAGRFAEHTVPDDFEDALVWPDSPIPAPSSRQG